MGYLGNAPALAYTSFAKQDFTVTATTSYSLDQPVANANELALFINFVRQEPTTAYSASGTTLTLTSATSSSDDMYCVYLGKAVQTVNPPNGSVGTSQLASTSVTPAKMDLSQDYTFTGKISGQNYPAFHVQESTAQTVSDNTVTKVTYGAASIDTDSGWDTSNDRWTVPSGKAGKYVIIALLNIYSTSALDAGSNYIRVNGTTVQTGYMDVGGNHDYHLSITCSTVKDLSVGDYVEHWGLVNGEPAGTYKFYSDSNILRSFSLYRIGN